MNILVQYIQQNIRLGICVVPVSNLIENLGMTFRNISIVPLLTLYELQVDKAKIGKRFQIVLYIGSGRTDNINVDRQTMSGFPKDEHKCRTTLEDKRTPGFDQHFKKGQGADYFLYEVLVIVVQFGCNLFDPFCRKTLFFLSLYIQVF